MTVPKHFRRNSRIPEVLLLHRADLAEGDVQEMYGMRVTRPLRTILDLLEDGRVDRTLVRQVIDEAMRRGLVSTKQIDSLPHDKVPRLISRACWATPLMDEAKQYKTAGAFRTALETRLQTRAQEETTDLQRLGRQVLFDRFLARLFPQESKGTYPWILMRWSCGFVRHERRKTSI